MAILQKKKKTTKEVAPKIIETQGPIVNSVSPSISLPSSKQKTAWPLFLIKKTFTLHMKSASIHTEGL